MSIELFCLLWAVSGWLSVLWHAIITKDYTWEYALILVLACVAGPFTSVALYLGRKS